MSNPLSQLHPLRKRQQGTGLLEVMVAVVILTIGLLGMAGLQARALKGSQSSLQRSQAVMLSYFVLDAIRADRSNAKNYTMNKTCTPPSDAGTLISHIQNKWITNLRTNLGSGNNTCGTINCVATGADTLCTVSIQWDDSRAGGSTTETIQISSRL
jgi:type IV pilus assembly protein PilV